MLFFVVFCSAGATATIPHAGHRKHHFIKSIVCAIGLSQFLPKKAKIPPTPLKFQSLISRISYGTTNIRLLSDSLLHSFPTLLQYFHSILKDCKTFKESFCFCHRSSVIPIRQLTESNLIQYSPLTIKHYQLSINNYLH